MLTKLLPDQIAKFWDIIKYAIEDSIPPTATWTPNMTNKILTSLLCGKSHCWISYIMEGEQRKLEAVVVTQILYDDISDTRNLLIYCLCSYETNMGSSWLNGLKALVKFATFQGCKNIVAYTDVPSIIKIVKRLGGETNQTFISLPLLKN